MAAKAMQSKSKGERALLDLSHLTGCAGLPAVVHIRQLLSTRTGDDDDNRSDTTILIAEDKRST